MTWKFSMSTNNRSTTWHRDELFHLLSISATLAGLCITGVTLFHTVGQATTAGTIADDFLAGAALLFLLCTYTIFIALRGQNPSPHRLLVQIADILFLLALTGMVVSGFIMAYTVW